MAARKRRRSTAAAPRRRKSTSGRRRTKSTVAVRGYTKRDGTRVRGHRRAA